jgi:hypothetical protein
MVLIGCTPKGRLTEQHDVFFGIASSLNELKDDMLAFWPEAEGILHIDAWQKITSIENYSIEIVEKSTSLKQKEQLYFLNLGGYKKDEFEEYHYKVLTIAKTKAAAIKNSKQTTFYKHCGFSKAPSHIDEQYGIDVDDIHIIEDVLPEKYKNNFSLKILPNIKNKKDIQHIGYLKFDKIKES